MPFCERLASATAYSACVSNIHWSLLGPEVGNVMDTETGVRGSAGWDYSEDTCTTSCG